ncbi:HNH endonuclease [Saprospira grandis]|uniref:HNH nuclease domain-containing protein n=1 Tax=Saprospira grandis (strain Lewin) TaxID=984262 RepID=H6KZJ0_SAPGL|nr:HNH endonuclease [Saprospira grandis]AFC25766.1 hypothetical protein SGRA_3038 [Saprospira grandis str. Lewin]
MRKVNKDFSAAPQKLVDQFADEEASLIRAKEDHSFNPRIYNTAIKSELEALYHHKCAYCESPMGTEQFTVEHYRPKKGRNGYWWLGYEWSNLLPVCKDCNGPKADVFKVKGKDLHNCSERMKALKISQGGPFRSLKPPYTDTTKTALDRAQMRADSPYLLAEGPYLLHPEIDEPRDYIEVRKNGEIYSIEKGNQRAEETIKLVNLNRFNLYMSRLGIIDAAKFAIVEAISSSFILLDELDIPIPEGKQKEVLLTIAKRLIASEIKKLEKKLAPNAPYTLTTYSLLKNDCALLEKALDDQQRDIFKLALIYYKKNKALTP